MRSSDAARRRFLVVGGRLREIPASPPAFLRTDLFTPRAKLRVLGELLVPRRRDLGRAADDPATDESVWEFGRRRLGRDFAELMLDPMVKGIFGGDARRLSLAAAFPRMVELERDHGSLFRALAAISRQRKKAADAGPSGTLHSFRERHGRPARGPGAGPERRPARRPRHRPRGRVDPTRRRRSGASAPTRAGASPATPSSTPRRPTRPPPTCAISTPRCPVCWTASPTCPWP